MKNKIIYSVLLLVTALFAVSCEYDETEFAKLTDNAPDPNATYYVQFKDASKNLESGVAESGDLVDIETSIIVALLGLPQSEAVTVNLTVDPSTTIEPNMYELSSSTVTIPAGSTGASVSFKTNTSEMPVGEPLKLVLNVDAGANTATAGTLLTYNLLRIAFCPLENGTEDLAGAYSSTIDLNGYGDAITTVASDGDLMISGLGVSFINGFWGEAVIEGGTINAKVAANGVVTIPRQYIYTTEYEGDPYDYEIAGTGKWTNCDAKPTLVIDYDIYYVGEDTGLAAQYFPTYLASATLGGTFTMN
ncbi:hypothetical protein SAMN04487911_10761 [Arenibacter nanhaiticus]|uniref:DUF1735 domain-containing protein n=1 Tax=Arenibacter nanhaiticus TaxID=558155 RepID=A0A1M6EUV7_9FLAO|nr:DUF1735 domain-containing protein [Arenibacter nanhaiticus]SHI89233.1 hypothetical protein SAMN04487911_10761 [Arenibacter nanhaiticus]